MYYNKEEQAYIKQKYDQFTGILKTLADYEYELQRALDECHCVTSIIYDKKRNCYKTGYQNEFALFRFLIARIKNCKVRINQIKQRC